MPSALPALPCRVSWYPSDRAEAEGVPGVLTGSPRCPSEVPAEDARHHEQGHILRHVVQEGRIG